MNDCMIWNIFELYGCCHLIPMCIVYWLACHIKVDFRYLNCLTWQHLPQQARR